jgi:hypothetical protein
MVHPFLLLSRNEARKAQNSSLRSFPYRVNGFPFIESPPVFVPLLLLTLNRFATLYTH